jgi:branched-chain amino acid transport system substrate-binding protein
MQKVISALTFAVTGLLASAGTQAFAADTVKIGVPIELSGRFVAFGGHCKQGVEMASAAFGGKVIGKKIELLFRDVQSDTQSTVSAVTQLINSENVNYLIGPLASPIAAAAIPPWRQGRPLWMMAGASIDLFEKQVGDDPLYFHTFPYAYHYYETLSAGLKHYLGAEKRVAVIYTDDEYGRTHLPLVEKFFEAAGFNIVAEEIVRANTPDMNPVLTKINLSKPDILLGVVQTTDAIKLAKSVYIRHLNIPYLVSTFAIQLKEWQDAVAEAQDGWIGLSAYLQGEVKWPADPNYPKLFPSSEEWEKIFREKYGHEPGYYVPICYATTAMLLLAIEKAGVDDKEKVAEALRKLDVRTPYGHGKFIATPSGTKQQAFADLLVFQRQNGKSVVVWPLETATGAIKLR